MVSCPSGGDAFRLFSDIYPGKACFRTINRQDRIYKVSHHFSGLSGICAISGVLAGESGAFLFAAAGAGIAPIYPTVMAFLARRYKNDSDTAVSFTVIALGICCLPGNFLIGAIIDVFKNLYGTRGAQEGLAAGFKAGYLFIGGCALACSAVAFCFFRYLKKIDIVL